MCVCACVCVCVCVCVEYKRVYREGDVCAGDCRFYETRQLQNLVPECHSSDPPSPISHDQVLTSLVYPLSPRDDVTVNISLLVS